MYAYSFCGTKILQCSVQKPHDRDGQRLVNGNDMNGIDMDIRIQVKEQHMHVSILRVEMFHQDLEKDSVFKELRTGMINAR